MDVSSQSAGPARGSSPEDLLRRVPVVEAVLENMSDGFLALDRTWRITYLNRSFLKLVAPLYEPASALVGGNLWEKFPDIVGTPVERFCRESWAHGYPAEVALFHPPLNAWFELRTFPAAEGLAVYVRDITEETLRNRERSTLARGMKTQAQLFDAILSNLTDLAYAFDRELRFLYANRPLLAILGKTADEVVGRGLKELNYPEEMAARLSAQLRQVFTTGRPVRGETLFFKDAAGREDYHEYIYSPAFDATGNVAAVVGTTRLITERKRAERMGDVLRDVLQRVAEDAPLEEVFAGLVDMVELIDPSTVRASILLLDEGGRRLHHAAAPRLPARFNAEVHGLEIGPDAGSCGTAAWLGGPVFARDIATDPRWERFRDLAALHGLRACWSTPILSSQGKVLGTFAVYNLESRDPDAAEMRLVETATRTAAVAIERKRAEQALRQSESQLRLVADHASVFMVHVDRAHRYRFVNRAYAERHGKEPAEIVGSHVAELIGLKGYTVVKPHIERALAGERVELELEIPYESMGVRWVHFVYVPERAADGAVVGLVAVLSDITGRKQAELESLRARDEALAASRAKDDFLAALSHELRTPLNPVLLIATDGAANPSLPEAVRADFDTIARSVMLESRLIDDLLDLTRIARGKMPLNLQTVDVHVVINDAIATIRAELEAKWFGLTVDLAAPRSLVTGDPARLQQVFWNVLRNAVKFTAPGGRMNLTTHVDADAGRVVVTITDSGIGMTADELKRAFDSFAQGDHAGRGGSHRYGGLGLGLAISRMLTELHGGTICAESAGRGEGSTFTIELPLAAKTAARVTPLPPTAPPPAPAVQPAAPMEAKAFRRILLVEDHEPTRRALSHLLISRGYELVSVGTMTAALQAAQEGAFDLLVSDIGLPDGDGYELMATLREKYRLRGIALTGYGMEKDVAKSRETGFLAHLTKPVSIRTLEAALSTANASSGP